MASESDQSENAASAMSEEEASASESVRRYLLDHPEFFDQNTDLLRALTPVQQFPDSEVIDLQQFVVGRLRNDVSKLQTAQGQIIDASRANLRAQSEVHEAVLAILAADSFERMINTITSDLADLLRLDVVSLCVEAANNDPLGRVGKSAVYVLPVGAVDRIMDEHAFMLRNQAPPDDAVFGPATGPGAEFSHSPAWRFRPRRRSAFWPWVRARRRSFKPVRAPSCWVF